MTIERLAHAPLILYDARWAAEDPDAERRCASAPNGPACGSSR